MPPWVQAKKKWLFALLAAGVLLAAILLLVSPAPTAAPPSPRLLAAAQKLDNVRYDLVFQPENHTLSVTMEWDYQNRTGQALTDIPLRLPANAYKKEATSPAASPELMDLCYPGGFSPGGATLHDAQWNAVPADTWLDPQDETILWMKIPELDPQGKGTLRLRLVLDIPDCRYVFGRGEGVWMLGGVLPYPARYDESGWQLRPLLPVGDAPQPELANYALSLSMPEGYTCAAPFVWQKEAGSANVLTGALPAARDMGLLIYREAKVSKTMAGEVLVQSFADTKANAGKAMGYAVKALEFFTRSYGDYPYPVFTLSMADMPFAGMEYSGIIMTGRGQYAAEDSLEVTIAHETAHQWFSVLVGSDSFTDAWQDEAVSEYASLRYIQSVYGQAAFEQLEFLMAQSPMRENIRPEITPGSPLDRFYTMQEYSTVVYGRGLALMLALDTDMDLNAFLQSYVEKYAFSFASREDFEALLKETAGWDTAPLMTDYLDTAI